MNCCDNNIYHRDIKTKNILINQTQNGNINLFLADFGESTDVEQIILSKV
jgi:serine/threonine protein kinase